MGKSLAKTKPRKDCLLKATPETKYYLARMKKTTAFKVCSTKQRLFVINYVQNLGDLKSTMRAMGNTSENYGVLAHQIMKRDKVQKAIAMFWEVVFGDKINNIPKTMVDQLYRRAFTQRSKYFTKEGRLKDGLELEDLGPDECIIDGIEQKYYGKDADVKVIVYKLADRNVAYRELQKLMGLNITKAANEVQTSGVLKVPGLVEESEWEELN